MPSFKNFPASPTSQITWILDLLIMLHEKHEILFIVLFLFASSLILPHEVFSLLLIKFGLFFISFSMFFKISGGLGGFFSSAISLLIM